MVGISGQLHSWPYVCFVMGLIIYLYGAIKESGIQCGVYWTYDLQVGSCCLESPLSQSKHSVPTGRPLCRGPAPVRLPRKTNLYFIERAYCSQGVGCSQLLGLLWLTLRRIWSQNANHWLEETLTARPQGTHKKVNKRLSFRFWKNSGMQEAGDENRVLRRKRLLPPCFQKGSLKNEEATMSCALDFHEQDWCGRLPCCFTGPLVQPPSSIPVGSWHDWITGLLHLSWTYLFFNSSCTLHFYWSVLGSSMFTLVPNASVIKECFLLNPNHFATVGPSGIGPCGGSVGCSWFFPASNNFPFL